MHLKCLSSDLLLFFAHTCTRCQCQPNNIFFSVFSVFQIVKFNNDACTAVDGKIGSCYTLAECTSLGGGDGGSCASGFGVCCICEYPSGQSRLGLGLIYVWFSTEKEIYMLRWVKSSSVTGSWHGE